jgi:colanic acid biosynthesis glycosyl transferase WcaI
MTNKKRILFHTQYFPPEIGAPQARLSELAAGLCKDGHLVRISTAFPNYPIGRYFPGYSGFHSKESQKGLFIERSWIYPSNSLGIFTRLTSYFSFVFSSLWFGIISKEKYDAVLTESPPLFLGISGLIISRVKNAKWIFNISDLWPESAFHLGIIKKGLFYSVASWLEGFLYKNATIVSGQSKSIIENINQRYPGVKTYHLSNGVDSNLFSPDKFSQNTRDLFSPNNEIIFFYGGLHGLAQGLDQLLHAASKLHNTCKFVLVGDGPEKKNLVLLAKQMQLTNVIFHDPVKKEQMPELVASMDVCIVPLKITLPGAVPSKIYEAMASEKPVLLVADGEAKEIIEGANAGLVVRPGDIDGLVETIQNLMNDPELRFRLGKNGRKIVLKKFDREKIINDFSQFLEGMD